MHQSVTQQFVVRACSVAAFAALASSAWAGSDELVDARTAAARSLFTAQHAIGAPAPAQQASRAPAADGVDLEQQRGGTDTYTDMKLDGNVANNSATNVVTGNNVIDAGSFANMSGIPVVIQNSGANVLIQNATIINLQFK
jgi:ABC-type sulfate transport system substrate-binding protein